MWWLVPKRASNLADEPRLWTPEPKSPEESGAALGAQIGHLVNRPDLIRQRAQNSAAISGAAATAVAGFAALSGLARGTLPLIVLGFVLCSWIAAMAIYAHAITYSYTADLQRRKLDVPEPHCLADVVKAFTQEAEEMRRRVRAGRNATWLASGSTIVAVLLLVSGILHTTQHVQISLTPDGATSVARTCAWEKPRNPLKGKVNPSDLDKGYVPLKVAGCNGKTMTTLHVRNTHIRATAQDP